MTWSRRRSMTEKKSRGYFKVGAKVRIATDKYYGKYGTIVAVDKRFVRPFTVEVQTSPKKTLRGYYGDWELRFARKGEF